MQLVKEVPRVKPMAEYEHREVTVSLATRDTVTRHKANP